MLSDETIHGDYIHAHEDVIQKVNDSMPEEEILCDLAE